MSQKLFNALSLLLIAGLLTLPTLAKRVTTDGKNPKVSPVTVTIDEFYDAGYGMPGPQATIRMKATVRNTSTEDDLRNVVVELQLKNLAGDVVQKWTRNVSELKKGQSIQFESDMYYNQLHNNLQGAVEVSHDEPVKKEEKKGK